MSNELSISNVCVQMRSGIQIWIDEDTSKKLQQALQGIASHKFICLPDGKQTINTADVVGVFGATTMSDYTRRLNGDWQCLYGTWHAKKQTCDCHITSKPMCPVHQAWGCCD